MGTWSGKEGDPEDYASQDSPAIVPDDSDLKRQERIAKRILERKTLLDDGRKTDAESVSMVRFEKPMPDALTTEAGPALPPTIGRQARNRLATSESPGFDLDALADALPSRNKKRSKPWLRLSFLVFVVIPALTAACYLWFFAADQYVAEFRFMVRSQSSAPPSASSAISTAISGTTAVETVADNFMVVDYLQSAQAVDDLQKTVDIRKSFSQPRYDWLFHFDPSQQNEQLVKYWQRMIDASYDVSTGLATVQVRAFSPDQALQIARSLVNQSKALVNEISMRARQDAVAYAENDTKRAEDRLRAISVEMREFRDLQQTPNAGKSAGDTLDLASKLRADTAAMNAQLTTLRSYMAPNAPSVRVLVSKIAANQVQIAETDRLLGLGGPSLQTASKANTASPVPAPTPVGTADAPATKSYSNILSRFEDLTLNQQFAQKLYDSTLSNLEAARSQAGSQNVFLAMYVQPMIPQKSLYPNRPLQMAIFLLSALAIWFIGVMMTLSIRDHVA